jgi:hypothetical protein
MANADWALPKTVRMGLTSMMDSTENNNNMPTASTADFLIVSIIPYTGKSTMMLASWIIRRGLCS